MSGAVRDSVMLRKYRNDDAGPRHTTAAGHVDLGTTPSPQAIAEDSGHKLRVVVAAGRLCVSAANTLRLKTKLGMPDDRTLASATRLAMHSAQPTAPSRGGSSRSTTHSM